MSAAAGTDVIARIEGRAGRITMNRPKALNALTYPMVQAIRTALADFAADPRVELVLVDSVGEKPALCAGGDVRAIYESRLEGDALARAFWSDEYRMNGEIARYPKPFVAFMDGIVMGGGIGLSAHGSHRIVTERSMLAMPETTIGLIPDVGGTWLLGHAPGRMGEYLGLTSERMNAADAIYAGFADTHVESARLGELAAALCDPKGAAAGVTIARFASAPAAAVQALRQAEIDRLFSADSVPDILAALETAADVPWAAATRASLDHKSPLSMTLTLAAIRNARTLANLERAIELEYRMAIRLFRCGELNEGVRALLVDKDRNPKWNPPRLADVPAGAFDAFTAPLGDGGDLVLPGSDGAKP